MHLSTACVKRSKRGIPISPLLYPGQNPVFSKRLVLASGTGNTRKWFDLKFGIGVIRFDCVGHSVSILGGTLDSVTLRFVPMLTTLAYLAIIWQ